MFTENAKTFILIACAIWAIVNIGIVHFDHKHKSQHDAGDETSYSTHVVQDITFVKGSWLERNAVQVITDDGTFVFIERGTSYFPTEEQTHLKLEVRPGLTDATHIGNLYLTKDDFLKLSKEYADTFNRTMQVNDTIED